MKKLKFYSFLSQSQFNQFLRYSSFCWFQKGSTIFEEKKIVQSIYILLSGTVSYSSLSDKFFIGCGESFGEVLLKGIYFNIFVNRGSTNRVNI